MTSVEPTKPDLKRLECEMLALPDEDRWELTESLLASFETPDEWSALSDDRPLDEVIEERVNDLITGRVAGIPWDEAMEIMRRESMD